MNKYILLIGPQLFATWYWGPENNYFAPNESSPHPTRYDAVACSFSAPCLFKYNDLSTQPGSAAIIANIFNNFWNPLYDEYYPPLEVPQDINKLCQSIIDNKESLAPYTRDVRLPSLGSILGYLSSAINYPISGAIYNYTDYSISYTDSLSVHSRCDDFIRLDFIGNNSTSSKIVPIHNFASILVNAGSNLDTLYTPAWLDLTLGRYYILPRYESSLRQDLDEIKATTFNIYILGRVYTTATAEEYIALVNKFQGGFIINSHSDYLHRRHPTSSDTKLQLKDCGPFRTELYRESRGTDPTTAYHLRGGAFSNGSDGRFCLRSKARPSAKYSQSFPYNGARVNGWSVLNQTTMGSWRNFYSKRWPMAVFAYAADPVEDTTIYPGSLYDSLMHSTATQSLLQSTCLPLNGFCAVDNLVRNPDGSMTIYIQNALPKSTLLSNWLSVGITTGPIIKVLMRLFTGTWAPLPIIRGAPV
eukprot:gene30735-40025_t